MNCIALKEFMPNTEVTEEIPSFSSFSDDLTGQMVTRIFAGRPIQSPEKRVDDVYRFGSVWTVPSDSSLPLGNDPNHKFYGYTFVNDDRSDEELEALLLTAAKDAGATGYGRFA